MKMIKIALFASGNGSNVENIVTYFAKHPTVEVSLIVCNNKSAHVLERAKKLDIPSLLISKEDLYQTDNVKNRLKEKDIQWVVLAGFLWLIPEKLIAAFPNKIINIHPALLPKYGGKGMYGMAVHQAVIENKERCSGITIHYVNNQYDEGNIIFQQTCNLQEDETPETLAEKIHSLEYQYYPFIIEKTISVL